MPLCPAVRTVGISTVGISWAEKWHHLTPVLAPFGLWSDPMQMALAPV